MEEFKGALKEMIKGVHILHASDLDYLIGEYFSELKPDELKRAISELVQSNEIQRFEYILSGEHTRRQFYMSPDCRLMP